MIRPFLGLAIVLGAVTFGCALARGPSPQGPSGETQPSYVRQSNRLQQQEVVRVRVGMPAVAEAAALTPAAKTGDMTQDQIRQWLRDGSCVCDTDLSVSLAGDQDRIRDGSCDAADCTPRDNSYDHNYDHQYDHDGPTPDGRPGTD